MKVFTLRALVTFKKHVQRALLTRLPDALRSLQSNCGYKVKLSSSFLI
jgi:hypothetical protein